MKLSKTSQRTALLLILFALIGIGTLQAQDTLLTAAPGTIEQDMAVKSFKKFRLSINGGYSYRINKIHDDFQGESREYMQDIKSGTAFSLEGVYYFRETIGFGWKYALHQSSNSANITMPSSTGYQSIHTSDDISISFFGPVMGTRFFNKTGKNALILQYGLGYMGFKNNSRRPEPMAMSGGTLGSCYDLGFETFLAKGLTLGLQVSYLSGMLTQIKISDGNYTETIELEKENYEGLARFD